MVDVILYSILITTTSEIVNYIVQNFIVGLYWGFMLTPLMYNVRRTYP